MKNKPIRVGTPEANLNRSRGFTLVELLVVITIIAVLAGVVFALTQKIKASAYRATAMTALRQVSIGNIAYSAENNGDINFLRDKTDPLEGNNLKGIGDAWVKNTFWGRLQPYIFSGAEVASQSQLNKNLRLRIAELFNIKFGVDEVANGKALRYMTGTVISGTSSYYDTSGLPVPFAFNTGVYKFNGQVKVSSVSDPSQILYLTFGSYRCDATDGQSYAPLPINGAKVTNNIFYLDDRKAICTFVDGHIESLSAPIPARRFK